MKLYNKNAKVLVYLLYYIDIRKAKLKIYSRNKTL